LVFRRVLPSHLFYYLGGSFFIVSAQTYITPIMLAILAHLTLQLLYDPVANSLVDVANLEPRRNRTGNFNVVFQGLCVGKKSPW
jgi:hypothetical protein